MAEITEFFSAQHRQCDRVFEDMENAVSGNDWPLAQQLFDTFSRDTLQHFANEEQGLFALFEEKTGIQSGPTQVMRNEHVELRSLLQSIGDAIEGRDKDEVLGTAETFFLFLQQHNVKEEQVLYPMADQMLPGALQELPAKVPGFPPEHISKSPAGTMKIHNLDVRDLEAPEPLERILDKLEILPHEDQLNVTHRREPLLLYPILEKLGYHFTVDHDEVAGIWQICISKGNV